MHPCTLPCSNRAPRTPPTAVCCSARSSEVQHSSYAAEFIKSIATVAATLCLTAAPAQAVLNSPNAQIARSTDAALRRATPAFNYDVKAVQDALEDIQFQMRIPQRKPWGSMSRNVQKSARLVSDEPAILLGTPEDSQDAAKQILQDLQLLLERLQFAVERKDIDRTSTTVAATLASINQLEVLQAPALSFQVPKAYRDGPLLTGRASVQFVVEKANGAKAFVDSNVGGTLSEATFEITLDGYSAPVTAGKFAALVKNGKFDSMQWSTGYLSLVAGKGSDPGAVLPLEILPIGDFEPQYRAPIEVLQGELPVLPLSIKGSCAMARLPPESFTDGYVSGEEFIIHLFDPQSSGLSGLSFDEGQFGVFGYVTKGLDDVVSKLSAGDKIVSARIISGMERLMNV